MAKPVTQKGAQRSFTRCCVPTCSNNAYNTNGVSFFRFPKDAERCRKWVANCGRKDLQTKSAEKLFANYRICSAHFKKEDFSTTHCNRLIWNAVPTVFKRYKVPSSSTGIVKAKQKYRKLFGFATRRKPIALPRNEPPVHATVSCIKSSGAGVERNVRPAQVETAPEAESAPLQIQQDPAPKSDEDSEGVDEGPRLPVFIEDHCYAVNSLAMAETIKVIQIELERQSSTDVTDMQSHPGLTSELMPAVEALTALGIPPQLVERPSSPSEAPSSLAKRPRSKKGPRLMQDFLLPHLDRGTFGDRLKWIDRANGIFQIGWYHKNGAEWKNDDCIVFLEWDRLKKRPVAQSPHYWMEAKQRFRAALGKVSYGWSHPAAADQKNVKIRKVKWNKDMTDTEPHPNSGSTRVPRMGRVHRPVISRIRKVSSPPRVKEEEEEEEEDDDWNPVDKDTPSVCHRCGYMTRNRRVFLRHRMMHRDVRAFCCRYCPQRFCLPESLFLHLQVHSETYPYTCTSCGVRTRLLLQLWRHELRRIAERVCLCHRCGIMCHVRSNLRLHLQRAHGIIRRSTKPYSCALGGKAAAADPFSDTSSSLSPLPPSKAAKTKKAVKRPARTPKSAPKPKKAKASSGEEVEAPRLKGPKQTANRSPSAMKSKRAKTAKAAKTPVSQIIQSSSDDNMSALDVLSSTSVTLAELEAAARSDSVNFVEIEGQVVQSGDSVMQVTLDDMAHVVLVSAEPVEMPAAPATVAAAQTPAATSEVTAVRGLTKRVRVPKKILSL
uniref:Putative 52 kd repressor of inhibitor of protein kinase n=1 Tax=Ornithodoros turicata TaxID=34597 RepID=A0A2R5L8Y5_9ACAR